MFHRKSMTSVEIACTQPCCSNVILTESQQTKSSYSTEKYLYQLELKSAVYLMMWSFFVLCNFYVLLSGSLRV